MMDFLHPFDVRIPFIAVLQLCDAPEIVETSFFIKCTDNNCQSPESLFEFMSRFSLLIEYITILLSKYIVDRN